MEWISVKDRLPGDGEYLVYSPAFYGVTTMVYEDGKWWFDESSPTSGNTHWMPLPEPPKD